MQERLPQAPWHEISPYVYVRDFDISGFSCNLYLIRSFDSPHRYVLVDSGVEANGDDLMEGLAELPVEYLILTHTHLDHAGMAKRIQSRDAVDGVSAKVIVHELEREFLSTGVPAPAVPGTFFIRVFNGISSVFTKKQTVDPCEADLTYPFEDISIQEGLVTRYGIHLHHCAGHTPGHLSVEWRGQTSTEENEEEGEDQEQEQEQEDRLSHVMILGDMIFPNVKPFSRKSVYPYDFPLFFQSNDIAANKLLVREGFIKILKEIRPQALFCAHVPAVTIVDEKTSTKKLDVEAIVTLWQFTEDELRSDDE